MIIKGIFIVYSDKFANLRFFQFCLKMNLSFVLYHTYIGAATALPYIAQEATLPSSLMARH